ncbi:sigma-70 family RNA polymerase sigma factor [Streptomyces sp. 891-h]|nr:sigma-70 family RNA polymerase sigma factor [Streptomyces sp. 891-h]
MLGSAEEAEDIVQDTYLRWHDRGGGHRRGDAEPVAAPRAWLAKVATNLCLNRLTSARARRERYAGPWLPEPVPTGTGAGPDQGPLDPLDTAERRDSVALALLVLLERLNPAERAVFVLREAFGYTHREVAEVLAVSEAHSRQLHRRARQRLGQVAATRQVGAARPSGETDRTRGRALVARFLAAAERGDLAALEETLAEDVTVWVDGGGRIRAARRPVTGRSRVAHYLVGARRTTDLDLRITISEINGTPAGLALAGSALVAVVVPETAPDGLVRAVRVIASPEKLRFAQKRLPPVTA